MIHVCWLARAVVGWISVADQVGYVLLAKGGADTGAKWRFRVVCRDGAIVRHGIELTSPPLFELPWHSVVEVREGRRRGSQRGRSISGIHRHDCAVKTPLRESFLRLSHVQPDWIGRRNAM